MADRPGGYDVAILGAGPIGCAIAYALARRKIAPVVLAPEGAGGAHAVSGRIGIRLDSPDAYARLCLRSIERYRALEEEIGALGYVRSGGLVPALTDADARAGMARVHQQAAAGLDVRWLPREEALGLEPSLSPEILGAAYSAHDGRVDPDILVRRLVKAARQMGGTFFFHCGHLAVGSRPGGFLIRCGTDEIHANRLVLVADADDLETRRQVGVPLPVRRVQDLVLITETLPVVLRHAIAGISMSSPACASAYQGASGEVVLDGPASGGIALEDILTLARSAARLLPPLASARVLRVRVAPRAAPSDGWPILGAAEENTYVAMAPEEITLCPVVGEILAEIIAQRRVPDEVEAFGLQRFSAPIAAPAGRDLRQDSGRTP